ncbi:hypothetical protein PIN31115_04239 [Pandoraea iniqua]|uniref:Uncharacterized protein n=1 Tax=Pandoraea iniqua TaxID=2508288 RepID=A0A5E4Y3C9_9BURK|nr:hypothetical protein PIN31115_04239 [Pandoraea iniqua]
MAVLPVLYASAIVLTRPANSAKSTRADSTESARSSARACFAAATSADIRQPFTTPPASEPGEQHQGRAHEHDTALRHTVNSHPLAPQRPALSGNKKPPEGGTQNAGLDRLARRWHNKIYALSFVLAVPHRHLALVTRVEVDFRFPISPLVCVLHGLDQILAVDILLESRECDRLLRPNVCPTGNGQTTLGRVRGCGSVGRRIPVIGLSRIQRHSSLAIVNTFE